MVADLQRQEEYNIPQNSFQSLMEFDSVF
jgi:hypothetical protein